MDGVEVGGERAGPAGLQQCHPFPPEDRAVSLGLLLEPPPPHCGLGPEFPEPLVLASAGHLVREGGACGGATQSGARATGAGPGPTPCR